jgi:hypothetical protein
MKKMIKALLKPIGPLLLLLGGLVMLSWSVFQLHNSRTKMAFACGKLNAYCNVYGDCIEAKEICKPYGWWRDLPPSFEDKPDYTYPKQRRNPDPRTSTQS